VLSQPIVAAEALAGAISESELVVIDCRHELQDPEAGPRKFVEGHIPGARHAHLDRDLARPALAHEGRHPLPSAEGFVSVLRHLGISNDSFVVVYDDSGGAMAARLWWMLRWLGHGQVAVLDGGIQAWCATGQALEHGESLAAVTGEFVAMDVQDDWVVQTDELIELLASGEVLLVDARARPRFEGQVEPIDPVAGHIPGALNLPFSELLTEDGTFLDPATLASIFAEILGGGSGSAAVTMCGSGVTACHLQLGLEAAGLGIGRLYVGSWSEWIRDPERPVAKT
jgi:thiosulfate/3-mercaptopyruvate sulfurtransferase